MVQRIGVIDSNTGGEPTRVVISGGPNLGSGSLIDQRERLRTQFDEFRSAVVNEPRGSDVMVGALLLPPQSPEAVAGVIFFNNVGPLGMCGHGTIGVAVTLRALKRIEPGKHLLETPVGVVEFELLNDHEVRFSNVLSYRFAKDVSVDVPSLGSFTGDIAWGGNWFFLINDHSFDLKLANVEELTSVTWKIRKALAAQGICGANGAEIDHIELFGPPLDPSNDSRNFVLCPGKAYDRSPCGTGTSAKLACLYEDGKLKPGDLFRQESIIGSVFAGSVQPVEGGVIPTITGTAFVNAESTLILNANDPFRFGIRP
ncbi:proline racemase family protein [Thalassoglobus sp. JC818]|uniref:proline racemase family protein n=1 Tax=Thalassoglobus sp. JC818 TaxID=3232136 RepID=UPI003457D90E